MCNCVYLCRTLSETNVKIDTESSNVEILNIVRYTETIKVSSYTLPTFYLFIYFIVRDIEIPFHYQ